MQKITKEFQLMIPDESWFDAPAPLTWRYYPVFTAVAHALHRAVRNELPNLYFRDPARLANVKYAYPMLVFQGSRYSTCQDNMFCHDLVDPIAMDKFFRMARGKLAGNLEIARNAALAAGLEDVAESYNPRYADFVLDTTRRNVTHRQPVNTMLAIEARLLHDLIAFSGKCPPALRARRVADFNKSWNVHLRRFCGKFDFTSTGPALLTAATDALIKAQQRCDEEADSEIQVPCDWAA